jgi:hypothetical protein
MPKGSSSTSLFGGSGKFGKGTLGGGPGGDISKCVGLVTGVALLDCVTLVDDGDGTTQSDDGTGLGLLPLENRLRDLEELLRAELTLKIEFRGLMKEGISEMPVGEGTDETETGGEFGVSKAGDTERC